MIHWLKTEKEYFDLIWEGFKNYEIRNNQDRNFQVDDILILAEGTKSAKADRAIIARVVSRMGDNFPGIQTGYVVLGTHILGRLYGDDVDMFTYHTTTVNSESWSSREKAKTIMKDSYFTQQVGIQ